MLPGDNHTLTLRDQVWAKPLPHLSSRLGCYQSHDQPRISGHNSSVIGHGRCDVTVVSWRGSRGAATSAHGRVTRVAHHGFKHASRIDRSRGDWTHGALYGDAASRNSPSWYCMIPFLGVVSADSLAGADILVHTGIITRYIMVSPRSLGF